MMLTLTCDPEDRAQLCTDVCDCETRTQRGDVPVTGLMLPSSADHTLHSHFPSCLRERLWFINTHGGVGAVIEQGH